MRQIEREIKILNIDVNYIKSILKKNGIEPKGKFIQDVYAFDLPTVDKLYKRYVEIFLKSHDIRGLKKLILEIKPCFDEKDVSLIEKNLGTKDILDFISDNKNDFSKLKLDLPEWRFSTLYGRYLVLKPTHEKIPFENRLFSSKETIAFTISVLNILKSDTPFLNLVSLIEFMKA